MVEYELVVETNCYAGNFEREMCAHITGIIGDCGKGKGFVEEDVTEIFEDIVYPKPDEHGCYRPVSICGKGCHSLEIYVDGELSKDLFKLMKSRAEDFCKLTDNRMEYVDKKLKILSVTFRKVTTTVECETIYME